MILWKEVQERENKQVHKRTLKEIVFGNRVEHGDDKEGSQNENTHTQDSNREKRI